LSTRLAPRAPEIIRRRFAASAAALELIEREFTQLREFESQLILDRVDALGEGVPNEALDRAWFIAVLSAAYPGRQTWSPVPAKDNFFRGLELEILSALKASGFTAVPQWHSAVVDSRVDEATQAYALQQGIAYEDVNHLPIAILAGALATAGILELEFVDGDLADLAKTLVT